jgi:hypothetical protein
MNLGPVKVASLILWLAPWPSAAATLQPSPGSDDIQFFDQQVRPLLERSCFECHSHQSGKMKNGLTLDSRDGWKSGGESGPAIVPGDPEKSLLIKAVRYEYPDLRMPPKRRLSDPEIAVLEEWVRRGAPDPRVTGAGQRSGKQWIEPVNWWSLHPLTRPTVPAGVPHPVDAFVSAKLSQASIRPAPEADRRTLIRRVTLDLQGLLPTPEAVDAFVQNADPGAYEELVDRLLASPRYGERWARHWLDTIHFADTHGFEHDLMRTNAWRYRDYVIDSLNCDTPWPRFIREQIAADVFFPDEPRLTVALGFLGAGPWDQSTAQTAPRTFEYLDRDDIVTQTMATFASSTVHCARCHDHKFDPITQEDYYALQAVFAGVGRGDLLFDGDPARARARRGWKSQLSAAEKKNEAVLLSPENTEVVDAWERGRSFEPKWQVLQPETFLTTSASILTRTEDGALLAQGLRPETDVYTVVAACDLPEVTAVRLEVLTDPSLPMRGPGRADNGNLHLSEFSVQLFSPSAPKPEPVTLKRATADFDQEGWTIRHALDGDEKTAWGVHPLEGEPHVAVFEFEKRLKLTHSARLAVQLKQLHGRGHVIGKFRLAVTDERSSVSILPAEVAEAHSVPPEERTVDQQIIIASYVLRSLAEEQLAALPPPKRVFGAGPEFSAIAEGGFYKPWAEPKPVHLLKRGDINQPGPWAAPGALSAITALPSRFALKEPNAEGERRRALADWLADEKNPLTWRSVVNRIWHYHFGAGLSDTLNDLGRMGNPPSNPELLDWLACEFRDNGASLKSLHRLIVTSAAYRRASRFDESAAARDPDNRLLWRGPSWRLDAEAYRDSVIALAGDLDLTMGGPGVQQFKLGKPIQLTPTVDYAPYDWNSPGAGRRSIYRFVYRGLPDPFLDALDFPDAAQLAPVRPFSASPLQALALFNSDFVLHHCARMAARLDEAHPTSGERVREAVRLAFQREPLPAERADLEAYAAAHTLAALCRILLNSNEFLFVN